MAVILDTNVILSAVTDRNTSQRSRAELLLRSVASGREQLVIPQLVLFETHYVLRNVYERPEAEIAAILADLVELPGVIVEHPVPLAGLFALWPTTIRELPDAALAALALERGDSVATFDARFIRRLRAVGVKVWQAIPHAE